MAQRYSPLPDQMNNVIRGVMWARVQPIIKVDFDYFEVLKLTTYPETREVLYAACGLAKDFGQAQVDCPCGERAPGFKVVFRVREPALSPLRTELQATTDPPELKERFDEWLDLRLQIGRDWGRVNAVVREVAKLCPTPAQMRYRFPAIRIIWQASGDAKLHKLAETHEAYKTTTRAPFLPYGLRESALDAAETLLTFTTLPRLDTPRIDVDIRATGHGSVKHIDPTGFEFPIW